MASLAFWNPEISKLQAIYKPATDRVLSWLRSLYGCSLDTKVNYYRTLASNAAREGKQMPDSILDDLRDAIELRIEAANWFRQAGTAHAQECSRHEHIISVLQSILSTFDPSLSSASLLEPSLRSTYAMALPPSRQENGPLFPQPQGFAPFQPTKPSPGFITSKRYASMPRGLKSDLIKHHSWRMV
jgi:hypothetical protein